MDNVRDLIPKDKFDDSSIDLLKTIDEKAVEPILGELLEWLKDINWPVAPALMGVLPRFHSQLMPHIKTVFNSEDDIWKCWVLCLIKRFPAKAVRILSDDIKRISEHPTTGESEEAADVYAHEIIEQFTLEIRF